MVYVFFNKDKKKTCFFDFSFVIFTKFRFIERFTSEKETEGIQDRIEMQTATAGYLSNSNISNLLIGNGYNNIGVVNDNVGNIEDFNDDLRVTGPHNSYLFFILKYGIIGFGIIFNYFLKLIKKFLKKIKGFSIKFFSFSILLF